MKLISLNIWCGKIYQPFMQFVTEQAEDTDIFCFQEILSNDQGKIEVEGFRANILDELKKVLVDFNSFYGARKNSFHVNNDTIIDGIKEGTAIFVRKNITVKSTDIVDIINKRFPETMNKDFSNYPVPLQIVEIDYGGKSLFINTIHAISIPGDKLDTEIRINQSKKILQVLHEQNGEKILVGDFNLMPDTESIKILDGFLRNLIKEFNIQDTRGTINRQQGHPTVQNFADFTFVSKNIKVKNFQVPDAMVSDHCPMILEFE